MRRLMTFLFGMVVGGALLLGAQQYHIIRAKDGFHLVPKIHSQLSATYVDIRNFTPADWAQHSDVALALINDNQGQLVEGAANDVLQQGVDRLLDHLGQQKAE